METKGEKIVSELKVDYIEHMGNDLTVVNSARVSYNKKSEMFTEDDVKLINYLAKNKHYSPFEHCYLTVRIECPLFIRSQIHRHRTFSYNEISRRYTSEGIEFFMPDNLRIQHESSKQSSAGDVDGVVNRSMLKLIADHNAQSEKLYNYLLEHNVARELARMVLPQNLMTTFWMSGNLRNWVQFLALRLDAHAQKEARDLGVAVRDIITEKFPVAGVALLENL